MRNIIWVFVSAINCLSCAQNYEQLSYQSEKILQYETESKNLSKLFSSDHSEREVDISESIKKLLRETSEVRVECELLRDEGLRMTESVGRQLTERDIATQRGSGLWRLLWQRRRNSCYNLPTS